MLVLFEHHGARALAHDKSVAIAVVGPRRAFGRVVETGRQRAARGKAGERDAVDRRFSAARHHHVGVAKRDQPAGVADGVSAGRAGGDHGMIGSLERMRDRHVARREIDEPAGDEERRDPTRTAVAQDKRGFRNAFDAADSGTDQNAADDLIVILPRMPVGVVERLRRRRHRKDDKVVDLALLFGLHPVVGIEGARRAVAARNLAGNLAGDIRDVEFFDAFDAAVAGQQPLPRLLDPAGERRHQSKTCDDDTSHQGHSRQRQEPRLIPRVPLKNPLEQRRPAHDDVQFSQHRAIHAIAAGPSPTVSSSRFFREI